MNIHFSVLVILVERLGLLAIIVYIIYLMGCYRFEYELR